MVASFTNQDSLGSQDALVVGGPVVSHAVTLLSGNLTRGAVLGAVEAGSASDPSGEYLLSASGASDGSQTPHAILAEDCDASGGAKETVAYFAGVFNENQLSFGVGHDKYLVREALRARGIHLESSIL